MQRAGNVDCLAAFLSEELSRLDNPKMPARSLEVILRIRGQNGIGPGLPADLWTSTDLDF